MPAFDDLDVDDTFTTYFTVNGNPSSGYSWIELASLDEFEVESVDNGIVGNYDIAFYFTDNNSCGGTGTKSNSYNFNLEVTTFNHPPSLTDITDVSLFRYEDDEVQTFLLTDDDTTDTWTITLTNRADDSDANSLPFILDITNYPCKVSACSVTVDPSDPTKRGDYELQLCVIDDDSVDQGVLKEDCKDFDVEL